MYERFISLFNLEGWALHGAFALIYPFVAYDVAGAELDSTLRIGQFNDVRVCANVITNTKLPSFEANKALSNGGIA